MKPPSRPVGPTDNLDFGQGPGPTPVPWGAVSEGPYALLGLHGSRPDAGRREPRPPGTFVVKSAWFAYHPLALQPLIVGIVFPVIWHNAPPAALVAFVVGSALVWLQVAAMVVRRYEVDSVGLTYTRWPRAAQRVAWSEIQAIALQSYHYSWLEQRGAVLTFATPSGRRIVGLSGLVLRRPDAERLIAACETATGLRVVPNGFGGAWRLDRYRRSKNG